MTADYIINQLDDVPDSEVAVEDWRRGAAAIDATCSRASRMNGYATLR